jgi:hypothetical protein
MAAPTAIRAISVILGGIFRFELSASLPAQRWLAKPVDLH